MAQPGYGQPGYGQPGYGQPGYGQPGYDQARLRRGGGLTRGRFRSGRPYGGLAWRGSRCSAGRACHLCDDARGAVIERCGRPTSASAWEERDITASPDDNAGSTGTKIPVALVDGVQIDFWRVSEARLRAALG